MLQRLWGAIYSVVYVSDTCSYSVNSSTNVVVNQAIADAGPDLNTCTGSFTMAALAPPAGSGVWSIRSGSVTITTPSSRTTTVSGLGAGLTATLRWTVTNGACSSFDDIVLYNSTATANAGPDIIQCGSGTFTMAANMPVGAIGTWTIISGSANITSPNSYNTTITDLPIDSSVTLRWTVNNPSCNIANDDIILTHLPITLASAGLRQGQCANGNFTMDGNIPTLGTGVWSFIRYFQRCDH